MFKDNKDKERGVHEYKGYQILHAIEHPMNVSTPLEISIEAGIEQEETESILKDLKNSSLVREKLGLYGITIKGQRDIEEYERKKGERDIEEEDEKKE